MTSSMTGSRGPTGMNTNQTSTGSVGFKNKVPKGYQATQLQKFTPEAMDLYKQMFGQVGPDSYLAKLAGGDESLFQEMEAPALRQFSELQGGIASRFSQGGGGGGGQQALGARRSSGFQNYMGQQASNFAQQLQGQRQGLQRQAIMDLAQLRHSLLAEDPYERYMTKKEQKQGFNWGGAAGAAGGAALGFFGSGGNPLMAFQGAQTGYNLGSNF